MQLINNWNLIHVHECTRDFVVCGEPPPAWKPNLQLRWPVWHFPENSNSLCHNCPTHLSHECPSPYPIIHTLSVCRNFTNEHWCASQCWCSPTQHTTSVNRTWSSGEYPFNYRITMGFGPFELPISSPLQFWPFKNVTAKRPWKWSTFGVFLGDGTATNLVKQLRLHSGYS